MRICDAHCDTLYNLVTNPGNANDITLERLQKGGVSLQTMAMYVGPAAPLEETEALFSKMLAAYDELKKQGWVQADDPSEAVDGQVKTMLSIEGCEVFARGLSSIEEYRLKGVRMAAVTWNHVNALATPACKDATTGLTDYGIKAIKEMQRLGIAVDVSHLNIAGFYDIFNKTDKAPMASHSCARHLCEHTRNLDDRQLKELFNNKGLVCLNFFPLFLSSESPCTLDTLVNHIDHMYQLGGQGMVGLGSDFDGIGTKPEKLDNPEDLPNLFDCLRKRGYQEDSIKDIAGEAFIRYFGTL